MAKMGISTVKSYHGAQIFEAVKSYHGAQIFEAVGLKQELIQKYFVNTPSRIEGLGLAEIARETQLRHQNAYKDEGDLPSGDYYMYHKGGDQPHILDPEAIRLLQKACKEEDYKAYKEYAKIVDKGAVYRLRDLLDFYCPPGCSIPIEEVEPVEKILLHFRTGAMSYGALSKEAHECIAIAMNRIGSMSNCGEGGEDPARFVKLENGDDPSDGVKQVSRAVTCPAPRCSRKSARPAILRRG